MAYVLSRVNSRSSPQYKNGNKHGILTDNSWHCFNHICQVGSLSQSFHIYPLKRQLVNEGKAHSFTSSKSFTTFVKRDGLTTWGIIPAPKDRVVGPLPSKRWFRVIWGWFHDTWGVERLGSWNLHQRKFIHSIKRDLPASARLWDVEGVNMYQETTNTKRFPTLSSVVFSRFHPVSGSLLHCHTFCECNLNMKQTWPFGLS